VVANRALVEGRRNGFFSFAVAASACGCRPYLLSVVMQVPAVSPDGFLDNGGPEGSGLVFRTGAFGFM